MNSAEERYREDFLLWCRECVRITDKLTGQRVNFKPNAPQLRLAAELERQRKEGKPIRVILLKARQWGGSTIIQVYMAWMQLVRHTGWNSLVCAHVKDAAALIKGMYSGLLHDYPAVMKHGKEKEWSFQPYEKTSGISYIASRDCRIAIGSSQAPDALRSGNYFMAHLSEAAFWGDGDPRAASAIIRTVCGTVPSVEDSLVVIESTANGTGNYFHREWERAVNGESEYKPFFVPWHEIGIYSRQVTDSEWDSLLPSLTDYERTLAATGLERGKIAWYHDKRREYSHDSEMMAEFPGNAEEAFATSGESEFHKEEIPDAVSSSGASPALAVFTPATGGSKSVMTLFSRSAGKICVECEQEMSGKLSRALEHAAGLAGGIPLAIVDVSDAAGVSHGRWCWKAAESQGVPLHFKEDSPLVSTDTGSLSEMIDAFRESTEKGCFRETMKEASGDYSRFNRRNAWHYPRILNRLVAVSILSGYDRKLDPQDFL